MSRDIVYPSQGIPSDGVVRKIQGRRPEQAQKMGTGDAAMAVPTVPHMAGAGG